MALSLPQALLALDHLNGPTPLAQDVRDLVEAQGLSATPDQVAVMVQALATRAAPSGISVWPEGRPETLAALEAQGFVLSVAVKQEEARLAKIRSRSFYQKARDYFRHDWPEIRERERQNKWHGVIMFGIHAFFVGVGASLGDLHHGSAGWGAVGGEVFTLVLIGSAIGVAISLGGANPSTNLPELRARQRALGPWNPTAVELRLWRSVPEVHAQVAALMGSPIGLREGDRPTVEAHLRHILAHDQVPRELLRFMKEAPQ
jgi:hypothetical protein